MFYCRQLLLLYVFVIEQKQYKLSKTWQLHRLVQTILQVLFWLHRVRVKYIFSAHGAGDLCGSIWSK